MKDNTRAGRRAESRSTSRTFLLNEKRTDVHGHRGAAQGQRGAGSESSISKRRTTRIERLRHDDLNNSEPLPASFDMVEAGREDLAAKKVEDASAPRQEAAVKGVTPSERRRRCSSSRLSVPVAPPSTGAVAVAPLRRACSRHPPKRQLAESKPAPPRAGRESAIANRPRPAAGQSPRP